MMQALSTLPFPHATPPKGATAGVAPFDPVDACLQLARVGRKELRARHGFSLRTGRTRRLAFRMRRAGAIMAAHPELIAQLRGLSLRQVLLRAERVGEGTRFFY